MSDPDETAGESGPDDGLPRAASGQGGEGPAQTGPPSRLDRFEASRAFWWMVALCIGLDLFLHATTLAVGPAALVADAQDYWRMGAQAAGGDIWFQEEAVPYRTPLYPLFLGLFQRLFAGHALFAAIVAQHVLVWATSLLAGLLSVRLAGRRAAFLVGYALSAACLTRTWFANAILSESLFVFLLTLSLLLLVVYFDRPTNRAAAMAGVLIGLAILVRPAAQLLWAPLIVLVWFRARRERPVGGKRAAAAQWCWYAGMAGVLLVPWVVRNQVLFGEPFLAQNYPRSRWNVCFQGGSAAGLPIPRDEAGTRLLEAAGASRDEVAGQHVSFVEERLRQAGYTQDEINELLRAVCNSALREHPGRFAAAAARRFVNYWRCVVQEYPFFGDSLVDPARGGPNDAPRGQALWRWGALAQVSDPLLRRVPFRSLRWNEVVAAATFLSLLLMLRERRTRFAALAIGLMFLYFNLVTAVVVIENYRYRMILEPAMAAVVSFGIVRVVEAWPRADPR